MSAVDDDECLRLCAWQRQIRAVLLRGSRVGGAAGAEQRPHLHGGVHQRSPFGVAHYFETQRLLVLGRSDTGVYFNDLAQLFFAHFPAMGKAPGAAVAEQQRVQ